MEAWRAACLEEARALGVAEAWAEILAAFEAPAGPGDTGALPARIAQALQSEVDPDQAALFARRYAQVAHLLEGLAAPEARWLAALLPHRAAGLLAAPPPRATRIRALVDFVFSHAAVVAHRDPDAPSPAQRVRSAGLVEVAPGVAHATVAGPSSEGPLHLNLLRLSAARLEALDARPWPAFDDLCAERRAVAAFSGGFFLYSEPDIAPPSVRGDPVGLLVHEGRVEGAPVFRRGALVQEGDGAVRIGVVGPEQASFRIGDATLRPTATNDPAARAPCAFNRAFGEGSPDRPERAVAMAAGRVVAVGRGARPIPLAGLVLVVPEGPPIAVGDRVEVSLPGVRTAMGGGPLLLGPRARRLALEDFAGSAPPVTFSRDETFDTNRLPRLAVGTTPSGVTWVVAVDGRNFHRAPGLTLRQTAGLLEALGCDRAVNLDGGSSKRMWIAGRIVDLPSTEVVTGAAEERVRPVHSAVLVHPAGR